MGGGDWKGKLDEIMFFKRALKDEEIKALYDVGNLNTSFDSVELEEYPYKIYAINLKGTKKSLSGGVLADTANTFPEIILKHPLNQTRTSGNVEFKCSVKNTNQNSQLASVSLYWDYQGAFRQEETKLVNSDGDASFTKPVSDSMIDWNCYACDNLGNCGFAKENNSLNIGRNDYYIATNGNNQNPGTLSQPFLTIQKCAEIALPGDTCYVRQGTYREAVTPKNSGNEFARITYKAYNNEEVTVSGADEVIGWIQHTGNIYKTTLGWDLGWNKNQIFVNKQMMLLARWPNTPSLDIMKPATERIESGINTSAGYSYFDLYNSNLTHLPGFWDNAKIHLRYSPAYWTYVGTVLSNEPGKIYFRQHSPSDDRYPSWGRFYLMDDYDALDSQGEWYYNNETHELFLWSPGGGNPQGKVEAKARELAFNLSNLGYITVEGIDFFSAGVSMNKNSHDNILDSIDAKYVYHDMELGTYLPQTSGIILDGKNNKLTNSHIQYSSCNGVSVNGQGHEISNSEIHDVNSMGTYCATINTVGRRVKDIVIVHNTLHDSGRDVLAHAGAQNMKLMYNEMYNTNVGGLTSDLGVTYANSYDYNGTEIAYNIIYDTNYSYGGIYLDYRSMNANIHHNIIYNIRYGTIFHSPHNIVFDHNTVVNSSNGGSWWVDGEIPGRNLIYYRNNLCTSNIPSYSYAYFENNLISSNDSVFVDKANWDFHLRQGSPAIDYGNDLGYTQDIEGNPIVGKPDAGAYEYQGNIGGTSVQEETKEELHTEGLIPTVLSWFRGFLTANTIKEITGYFLRIR